MEAQRPDDGVDGFAVLSPSEAACINGGGRFWRPVGMTADGMIVWGWVDE